MRGAGATAAGVTLVGGMDVKQISVKGLADFMGASHSRQRTIIRQFKYPREDEAHAKIIYYREAREVIESYHRADRDVRWLHDLANQVEALGNSLAGRGRTRLRYNAGGIRAYAAHFARRRFKVLDRISLPLVYADVRITAVPDLHVREGKQEKIVKLEFSVDPPSDAEIKVIPQLLFEAATAGGLGLSSSGVLYLDVLRGEEHRGARAGSQMRRNIEAACETISDIWDKI